ncbi:MAG TPA: hypothetical protein VM389_08360 [Phycisphaerae bacterium]|nr:hypothetical protein [Phycisphaerae bacterium]HUU22533.1 hypothetical protein [Phycisphaerae bacterium]
MRDFTSLVRTLCLLAVVALCFLTGWAVAEREIREQLGLLACAGSIALLASAVASREQRK